MLSRFFPKEFNFFEFFDKQAVNLVDAAACFREIVAQPEVSEESQTKMKEIERNGDKMAYAIMDHLNKTFITPFDREDIHQLAKEMDEVNDIMNTVVARMRLYKLKGPDKNMVQFAELITQAVNVISGAVAGLRDMKNMNNILKACVEVGNLESLGDRLRDSALMELFENEKDPIQVIKWKEIYQIAETSLDICKHVAHNIESILVKQA
ncbi:MAG: DUF47 family protein [Candidatus Goldbacteria bacterium]|nr:DUF47 family protein [Candidatus Goldiibacteriota bacterium]